MVPQLTFSVPVHSQPDMWDFFRGSGLVRFLPFLWLPGCVYGSVTDSPSPKKEPQRPCYIQYFTLYQVKFRVSKFVPSANPPYNQYYLLSGRFISGIECIWQQTFGVCWVLAPQNQPIRAGSTSRSISTNQIVGLLCLSSQSERWVCFNHLSGSGSKLNLTNCQNCHLLAVCHTVCTVWIPSWEILHSGV